MEKIFVDLNNPNNKIDKKIFGHFCEHAFENIYGGLYDPGNKNADKKGIRTDVMDKLSKVKPTILRYPGGNFVSNYHWKDGIGPKEDRKRVFEYAWLTEESNQFGTADFIEICRRLNAEPYLCINMGTGTINEAMNWVEYCNGTGNTYYANLRRSHGYEAPFDVKYWGLGNEMFGPWQMNYLSADDYALKAMEFAKAMKWVDPSIKLVACGYEQKSDWNYTVIKKLWQLVDYVSAHHYSVKDWGPFDGDDYLQTMCIPEYMEKLNKLTVAAVLTGMNNDSKNIKIAWDEWNMYGWLFEGVDDDESYTLQNAIVTACILNMFINNSDTIGMANYSTFVNINGAISVKSDGIVERPQYHVFNLFGNNIGDTLYQTNVLGETFMIKMPNSQRLGRETLNINLVNPESEENDLSKINYLSVAATGDDGYLYLSVINRHPEKNLDVEINFYKNNLSLTGEAAYSIYNDNVQAANTMKNPGNVTIETTDIPVVNGNVCKFIARKHSINLLKFKMN